jgi:hypothetical protein
VAEEHTAEEIARLKQEIEVLKKENERLRRLLEEALRAGKRQAAPFSRQKPKAHPQKPGRKAGKQYGLAIVGPSPIKSMKLWKYRCRPAVRDAAGGWKSARPFLSSKPRFRNRGWSALSFAFLWGAAGVADDECKDDIHGKPRMPSAVRPRN